MSFFSWLRNSKRSGLGECRRIHGPSRPRSTFRPHLEALEDRWVPSTLKVTSTGDSGKGTLRYEIAQAQSNDTIVFDFGNKKANSTPHTITLTSGELDITKNLTIQGPGAGLLTVTSFGLTSTGQPSNDSSRIFEVERGVKVALSGMTVTNGDAFRFYNAFSPSVTDPYDGAGGGVLNLGTLTISGCTVSNNFADFVAGNNGVGGAGVANFGTLTVSGCTLSNNSTNGNGGGIYNAANCKLTISGGSLSGNTALSGGGVGNFGTMTVSGCTVSGNTAAPATGTNTGFGIANGGGGILNWGGTLTVSNSTFSGNTPDNIAGPFTDGGGNTFN